MKTLVAYPKNEAQAKALIAVYEALEVNYDVEPVVEEKPYNPVFVAKVLESQQEFKEGKGRSIDLKEFFEL